MRIKLMTLFLFLSATLFAQKKKGQGYFSANAGIYKLEKIDPAPYVTVSGGVRIKEMGIGVGIGITQFEGFKGAYVPLFITLLFALMLKLRSSTAPMVI